MLLLYTIQSVILGAILGRMYGNGHTMLNKHVTNLLSMLPFVFVCMATAGPYGLLALIGMFGIATGHGQYFLSLALQQCKPEYFDFIIKPLFGDDPRTLPSYVKGTPVLGNLYERCLFGMFVTGSIVGIPAAIVCISSGNILGVALLLTGLAKAASYLVCDKLNLGSERAEYLNGALRTLLTCITFIGVL